MTGVQTCALPIFQIQYVGNEHPQKSPHAGKAVYWFLRDVEKGEEIFGNYGDGWGRVFNWANKVENNSVAEQSEYKKFFDLNLYALQEFLV